MTTLTLKYTELKNELGYKQSLFPLRDNLQQKHVSARESSLQHGSANCWWGERKSAVNLSLQQSHILVVGDFHALACSSLVINPKPKEWLFTVYEGAVIQKTSVILQVTNRRTHIIVTSSFAQCHTTWLMAIDKGQRSVSRTTTSCSA